MKTLLTLLAEAECWLGVEPLGEEQWAEVAELRERVLRAIGASTGKRDCRECRGVGSTFVQGDAGMGQFKACPVCAPTSEKEPLPKAAGAFLSDVAAKRGLDGLE